MMRDLIFSAVFLVILALVVATSLLVDKINNLP